ncbi:MAG: ligand-binding sensor domain-containing protein, partial [Blastocatellia bacterium]
MAPTVFDSRQGLPKDCIWSVYADRDGTIWAGTWDGGLVRLKDGKVDTYTTEKNGLSNNVVLSVFRDSRGSLWVGTGNGLNLLRGDRFVVYGEHDGLVGHDIRTIAEDSKGALWIGTTSGLSRLKDGQFASYTVANGLSNNFVRDVYEDKNGALWIATYGGGVNRFKDGVFTKCNSESGLSDDFISRILDDDQGNLWMSSNRGIIRVNKAQLDNFAEGKVRSITPTLYGVADGMRTAECNGGAQPAGWKAADGTLWFPTVLGAVRFDPRDANAKHAPPQAAIEGVQVDHQSLNVNGPATIAPGKGDMEFYYTGLDLGSPEKVQFRYKLDGYDEGWIDAGTNRIAYYTKIPPGNYTFRVQTVGDWGSNEAQAIYAFRLQAHFYQTTWFYVLCALALVFSGFGLFRLRVRALTRRAVQLETTVTERTAEIAAQKN